MQFSFEDMDRDTNRFASPWLLFGATGILALVVTIMAFLNIHRHEIDLTRIMVQKGAGLIRAFEAGTRTGMRGHFGSGVRLQSLLTETAKLEDVHFLAITDATGLVLAHSNQDMIGTRLFSPETMKTLDPTPEEKWKLSTDDTGKKSFTVYRTFLKGQGEWRGRGGGEGGGGKHRGMPRFLCPGTCPSDEAAKLYDDKLVIFVGLDDTPYADARDADIHGTILNAVILFIIGLAGVGILYLGQRIRASRQKLKQSRIFASEVISSLPVGLVVTDRQNNVTYVNDVAMRLFALPSDIQPGKPASEVMPAELHRFFDQDTSEKIAGRHITIHPSNESALPLSVGVSTIAAEAGDIAGRLFVFEDLSELERLQNEVRRKEKLAAVGSLAAGVAHEIRNPLSSIKGFAIHLGNRFQEGSDDKNIAKVMVGEVDRVNRVITQLLDFTRPTDVNPREVDPIPIVERVAHLVEHDARDADIELTISTSHAPHVAHLDPDRFSQALLNVCLNAIQAMTEGGKLNIAAITEDGMFVVRITDNGPGVAETDLAQIFDPYFTTKPSGTGLGLSIVQKIMEAHGGDVTISSLPGQETTVSLRFPRA
ncbi:ATP-binding protein [Desulfovibrio inopinatus]|uniref:ATP-binding protein n=1 Tax=Desulfovibrio inopinatus TaxID=102109 RepID=UPI000418E020|nr:ATP-binding protein [Desulfovibrio inopinatus]